jgi:hypothetical protein
MLLTVTYTSAIHRERIIAFLFKPWLREHATLVRRKFPVYRAYFLLRMGVKVHEDKGLLP